MSGDVTVRGSVAYASQESWIYSASLRENILFGLPFNPDWYGTVIQLCALEMVSDNCYKLIHALIRELISD